MSVEAAAKIAPVPVVGLTEDYRNDKSYKPAALFDTMMARLSLKNDAAISRLLQLPPPIISKVRSKQVSITAATVLRIHDVTGWTISDIRSLMGVKSSVQSI
jgi:plasmid maintenance system antidote protein VapI